MAPHAQTDLDSLALNDRRQQEIRPAPADGLIYEQGIVGWAESDFDSLTTGGSVSDDTFDASHSDDDEAMDSIRKPKEPLRQQLTGTEIELLRRQRRRTEIRCCVRTVCYGEWMGKSACLIVYRFQFRTAESTLRFKNASVKINVCKNQHPGSHDRVPRSVHFFRTNKAEHKVERVFELTAVFSQFKQRTAATNTLQPESQADGGTAWTVAENWLTKPGIPNAIDTAVIVTLDGSKSATMEIKINTASTDSLDLTFPWSIPNPVIFSPGIEFGAVPSTLDFQYLSETDWRNILSTDNYDSLTCPHRDRIATAMIGFHQ